MRWRGWGAGAGGGGGGGGTNVFSNSNEKLTSRLEKFQEH